MSAPERKPDHWHECWFAKFLEQVAHTAGFDDDHLCAMAAIALAEIAHRRGITGMPGITQARSTEQSLRSIGRFSIQIAESYRPSGALPRGVVH